jgi:hypothetical protein
MCSITEIWRHSLPIQSHTERAHRRPCITCNQSVN